MRLSDTMTPLISCPTQLSDEELIAEVKRLAGCEREATARLIAHLAELDARRLYLAAGFSSLFTYCTSVLRLSEHEAYNRIEAARAARRFPVTLQLLGGGALTLTAIRLLAPHLTRENHQALLAEASGKSRLQVEELLARRFPRPAVSSSVRKLPARSTAEALAAPTPRDGIVPAAVPAVPANTPRVDAASDPGVHPVAALRCDSSAPLAPSRRAVVAPLAPDQYKVTFTANAETWRRLRRAQELLRHQVPDGNLAVIIDRALSALLAELVRKKTAAANRPRPSRLLAPESVSSRHIPAAVKRAVWQRDEGSCAFVASDGRRCAERGFVEFHHLRPYAVDGEPTVRNIALRCRSHNGHEAELYFGPSRRMAAERRAEAEPAPSAQPP